MGRALTRAVLAAAPRAELTAATERPGQQAVGKDASWSPVLAAFLRGLPPG